MESRRVLFVSQEIMPYLGETKLSKISRDLPQGIQERGKRSGHLCPDTVQSMREEISFMRSSGFQG